jgi:hypothetical protein
MGKPSAPSAPDPYQSANAQYEYGTRAAQFNQGLNDVNTVGPTGSTTYTSTPGTYNPQTGEYGPNQTTQTTNLSPAELAILQGSQGVQEGQLGVGGQLVNEAGQAVSTGMPSIAPVQYSAAGGPIQSGIDTSGVPGIGPTQGYEQYGQRTALAGEMAALEPMQSQEFEQLDASLRNSGNGPGTPAYDHAMATLNSQIGGQDTQAAGAAITAGTGLQNTQYGEEANTNQQLFGEAQSEEQARNAAESQLFGQNVTNANLSNTAGGTALADWAQETGIPINELSAILGGSQVSAPSSIAPTASQVSAPDIMSAFQNQYAGQLSQYNAGVASNNSLYGDAAGLGALAYLAFS